VGLISVAEERELALREPSVWQPGESLIILGPDTIDVKLTEQLRSFLGAPAAEAEIEGVRGGDRLFVVAPETDVLACSYIFFDTTREMRRQARIYGKLRNTPIVGMSFTSPAARGRGLYRRILNEMVRYFVQIKYKRVVAELQPGNIASHKASQAACMRVCRELCDWEILNKLFVPARDRVWHFAMADSMRIARGESGRS
jgi:RimJ/RimL family protein N-acetyltransferase